MPGSEPTDRAPAAPSTLGSTALTIAAASPTTTPGFTSTLAVRPAPMPRRLITHTEHREGEGWLSLEMHDLFTVIRVDAERIGDALTHALERMLDTALDRGAAIVVALNDQRALTGQAMKALIDAARQHADFALAGVSPEAEDAIAALDPASRVRTAPDVTTALRNMRRKVA